MKRSPISTYFAVVVLLQSCLLFASARINYKGLVLTSIDVTPVDGKPNRVTFSGSVSGSLNDQTAVFLENVEQINDKDEDGKRLFEADLVTVARAKEIINNASEDGKGKPLFCIHGFNVQPGGHLKTCKKNVPKFSKGKFTLVPVIWPSKGGVANYGGDRVTNSVGAGRAFKTLKEGIDSFPSKSLLAHSMGNNVLRHAADSDFKFDNIFMAAADVRHDLFHESYIRSGDEYEKKDGLRLTQMLAKDAFGSLKGKIYILFNGSDYALLGSGWNPRNWVTRIGSVGNAKERTRFGGWRDNHDLIDSEIPQNCIENIGANSLLPLAQKFAHSYQFNDPVVKIYQDKHF
jgi:hypothetical protein